MSRKFYLLLVSMSASLALLSCQQAQPPTNTTENKATPAMTETAKKMAVTDLEALSNRLVTQVAGVKEGEIVFVNGAAPTMDFTQTLPADVRAHVLRSW